MTTKEPEQRNRRTFLVYIVESPSASDLFHKRCEGDLLMKTLELANIPSKHRIAVNSEAFYNSLTVELEKYLSKPDALFPLLHISAHGSEEGIQLTNGQMIKWHELRNIVIPINKASGGNLLICMSTCKGFSASRMAATEGELPFLGIIGHSGEPSWSKTAVGYITFYHLLSEGYSIEKAVEAMKVASGDPGFQEIQGGIARAIYTERIITVTMKDVLEKLRQERRA